MDDAVWEATVFTKNRDRLLQGDIARKFMNSVLNQPQVRTLLSNEHFSVDGTLVEAWASMKSFVPKDAGGKPPAGNSGGREPQELQRRASDGTAFSSFTICLTRLRLRPPRCMAGGEVTSIG